MKSFRSLYRLIKVTDLEFDAMRGEIHMIDKAPNKIPEATARFLAKRLVHKGMRSWMDSVPKKQ